MYQREVIKELLARRSKICGLGRLYLKKVFRIGITARTRVGGLNAKSVTLNNIPNVKTLSHLGPHCTIHSYSHSAIFNCINNRPIKY